MRRWLTAMWSETPSFITRLSLLLGSLIAASVAGAGENSVHHKPVFAVRIAPSGLDYRNTCGHPAQLPILDQNGQGVGLIDYDNDGLIDILLPNGSTSSRVESASRSGPRLYRNLGAWRFEDVTDRSGIQRNDFGNGVAIADYDADGDFDIYLTNWGPNALLRNNGDGTFSDVTKVTTVGGEPRWSSSAAFADFNGDGLLDLYVSNYVDFDPQHIPDTEADGQPCLYRNIVTGCGPWRYQGQRDTLYLQQADGRFRDASDDWGLEVTAGFRGFGLACGDFDNDGDTDVFVGCDVMPNLYLENIARKRFRNVGYVRGGAVNADGKHESGMGVAAVDWLGTGRLDLFVTNFSGEKNTHYRNRGGVFTDVSLRTGFDKHRSEMGWAVLAADFDQDGFNDVLVCNGHIYPQVKKLNDPLDTYAQWPRLYLGDGTGRLSELPPTRAFKNAGKWSLRGAAVGDLDNDGDLDVIAVQHNGPIVAFENLTNGPSMTIELRTRTGGRSPRDARVLVGDKWHAHVPNQGYQSSHDHRLIVPLPRPSKSLTVRWPDGSHEDFAVSDSGTTVCRQGAGRFNNRVSPTRK